MVFNTGATLLDAIVLAVVAKEEEGTYGYRITQDVRKAIDISESTLYPVLRRLQKDQYLAVYDLECGGRNRRYYKLTDAGAVKLEDYKREWADYSKKNIQPVFRRGVRMNRKKFLKQLEELLSDIPEAERRDAMNYYQNYFDDAGVEQEQTILEELGSPEKVAESIKRDLFGENYDAYVKAKQEKQQETIEKQQRVCLQVLL